MTYKKITLNNGLRIILVPIKDSLSSTILILVKVGSFLERKSNAGISHFLEHLAFKGTKKYPSPLKLALEFEKIGAAYNAFTSEEYTGYWIKVQNKFLARALELISELYLNPVFSKSDLEKERKVIIEEINMYEDMPEYKVDDVFLSLMYGDQPIGYPVIGFKETVEKISQNELLEFRKRNYIPQKTVVAVAGALSEDILTQIKSKFSLRKVKSRRFSYRLHSNLIPKPRVKIETRPTHQSHLVFGYPAFSLFDRRRYILEVLSGVLGTGMSSRLFQVVREKMGAAYYVSSNVSLFSKHGMFTISAGVDNKRIEKVILAIIKEINRIKKYRVSERELRKVKNYLIGNLYLKLERSNDWAGFYARAELMENKIKSPEQVAREIEKVNSEQIRKLANQIFRKKESRLAIVGPFKDKKVFAKLIAD